MTTQSPIKTLYEQDYYLWMQGTAKLLREGKINEVDLENLIEEIEAMSKAQKHALKSNLVVLLMHLLKYQYQTYKRSSSWVYTIVEHRRRLLYIVEDSPSLKRYFREVFNQCYQDARKDAATETKLSLDTFPIECPFSLEDVINPDYLP
jgi:hypothetical protein